MNKLVAPFAALSFVFSIAIAQADEAAGKVAQVDPATGRIMLEDGTIFTIGEGVSFGDDFPVLAFDQHLA